MSTQTTFRVLGFAGLLPFVVPVLWLATTPTGAYPWLESLVGVYALGIICFLTGSWWGFGLDARSSPALWLSNLVFLAAIALYVFLPAWWALCAALLLFLLFVLEQLSRPIPAPQNAYRQMRLWLTLIAGGSLFGLQLVT